MMIYRFNLKSNYNIVRHYGLFYEIVNYYHIYFVRWPKGFLICELLIIFRTFIQNLIYGSKTSYNVHEYYFIVLITVKVM